MNILAYTNLDYVFNGLNADPIAVNTGSHVKRVNYHIRFATTDNDLSALIISIAGVPADQAAAYFVFQDGGNDSNGAVQTLQAKKWVFALAVAYRSALEILTSVKPIAWKQSETITQVDRAAYVAAYGLTDAVLTTFATAAVQDQNTNLAKEHSTLVSLLMNVVGAQSICLRMDGHHYLPEKPIWDKFASVILDGAMMATQWSKFWTFMKANNMLHDLFHQITEPYVVQITFGTNDKIAIWFHEFIIVRTDALAPVQVRVAVAAVIWNTLAANFKYEVFSRIATSISTDVKAIKSDMNKCTKWTAPATQLTNYDKQVKWEKVLALGFGILFSQSKSRKFRPEVLKVQCAVTVKDRNLAEQTAGAKVGTVLSEQTEETTLDDALKLIESIVA